MAKQPMLTCMQGLPGSGKTTLAMAMLKANPSLVRVNRDDLRSTQGNRKYSKASEMLITAQQHSLIRQALLANKPVICDDTNLNPSTLDMLRQTAEECEAVFAIDVQCFDVPIQVCVERDAARAKPVGVEAILGMHLKYLAKPIVQLSDAVDCIIVDIDGTVAHAKHRNVHDLTRVYTDEPDSKVLSLVHMLSVAGQRVVFMSGREETCRVGTERWLCNYASFEPREYELHMRPAGDHRKDYIIKRELYEQHVLGKYNVTCVFDDRSSVVLLWRSLGLKCLQVNYGDF